MIKAQYRHFSIFISFILSFVFINAYSQAKPIPKGTVLRIKVHGKGLEGNLVGDSANRYVSIYLPASYKTSPNKHYPVIYFLHGYTDNDAKFFGLEKHWMNMIPILDSVFAAGKVHEMIVVSPNAYTRYYGSMYSSSVTTGDWEDFVSKELVAYIDSHYRTIANAPGRGLAGHSMGGYGSLRIGEKNPDVFSSIYLLSPCCLAAASSSEPIPSSFFKADSVKTFAELEKASFDTKITFATAAAWSPDPAAPPFYLDLPIKNGMLQTKVIAKWAANRPLTTLDQYILNLRKLKGIAFDAGARDENIAASIRTLDEQLNQYDIAHQFEIYEGDHINHVAQRIATKMLQFFSDKLSIK